jgi:sarcosine oxidase
MASYDAIVLGAGGVGSSAMMRLALRGARVLGIDRFAPGHDRGSSHGHTRLIRQAYYEHPDYVPLVLRAFELWSELEQRVGETLYQQVGLLQIGTKQGEVLSGVRTSASQHGLEIEEFSAGQSERRFPGFRVPSSCEAIFEARAGYLLVERCVEAHAEAALQLGAELKTGETVQSWRAVGKGVVVETDRGSYAADRLIVTAGAWAGPLLADLKIPLVVRRKPLYWFRTRNDTYRADLGCPAFLYDLPIGCFYGVSQIDPRGIKVAQHTGGAVVDDPLTVDREIDLADQEAVASFVAEYLEGATTQCTDHTVCMYTMTPDAHFIVDRHPEYPQVALAAGLSGHGFKFTSVLGELLCQLALDGRTSLPVEFLSCRRASLQGAP